MKIRWNHRYVQLGVTAFLVIAASMLFYYGIFHMKSLSAGIRSFFGIMAPIIYGAAIAYLLTPIVNFLERKIFFPIFKNRKKPLQKKGKKAIRWICVLLSVFFMFLVIYALVMMILPQLIRSVVNIIYSFPHYVNVVENWLNSIVEKGWKLNPDMINQVNQYSSRLQEYLTNTILPQMQSMMKNISASFLDLLVFLKNFLIGAIVSLYILADKEGFIAKAKMATYAVLPAKWATFLVHAMRFTHKTFGGFISGKILDSAIIGVLCYVGTSIIGTPYAILVSVIVGVTNIIPFFGPYLGAVPCTLLILLVDPLQSLYFVIFILVLQQFDGNILGPKILGESTGLSSFMVIVAIMIGGGLFGVPGMIVGVPIFAVLNAAVWKLIGRSLDEKEMSADAEFYRDIDCVDPISGKALPMPVRESAAKAKVQAVAVRRENNSFWSGAWIEIKHTFAYLAKFIQAKYAGFRSKQKDKRRKRKI